MDKLGPIGEAVAAALDDLRGREAVRRLWGGDHTLWQDDPTEVADRLGWLRGADEVVTEQTALDEFVAGVTRHGFTHVLVMGMGGSSLFPAVVARTFARAAGHSDHHVLDTTDAGAIRRVEAALLLDRTLFIASSKSGSTLETQSHLAYFWDRVGRPEQFAVITDPGSDLQSTAEER